MDYLLGIPFINRADLLKLALKSVPIYLKNTVVIDNSPNKMLRNHPNIANRVEVYEPPSPLSFSQSMNHFLQMSKDRQCQILMYMHTDAEAGPETDRKLLQFIEDLESKKERWGVIYTKYDTLAAYKMDAIEVVGPWDTHFPSYFCDVDWHYRMDLAGFKRINSGLPVHHHHNGSSSLKSDPNIAAYVHQHFQSWKSYYIQKWGGPPNQETFKTPFNQ